MVRVTDTIGYLVSGMKHANLAPDPAAGENIGGLAVQPQGRPRQCVEVLLDILHSYQVHIARAKVRGTGLRIRITFCGSGSFRLHKGPDSAPHQIDANLRPKVKIKFSL
jgi:hypothetical protein